jgi:hypothetical protein
LLDNGFAENWAIEVLPRIIVAKTTVATKGADVSKSIDGQVQTVPGKP